MSYKHINVTERCLREYLNLGWSLSEIAKETQTQINEYFKRN